MDASDGWAKRRRQEGGVRSGGSAPRARNVKALRRRAATTPAMATLSLVLSSSLLLLLLSLSLGVAGGVSGEHEWKECAVSPRDEWKQALADIPALRMRYDYERRYTCDQEKASYLAASYYFDSPCMQERFLQPADAHSCLRGRRIMFLGDSLANQQGDSLLGMLGWHPEFLTRGAPRNEKLGVDEDGHYYNTMVDCWHPADHWKIGWVERCYDYYSSDFPTPMPAVSGQRAWSWEGDSEKKAPSLNVVGRRQDEPEEEDGFSVHMRMLSRPRGSQWFERAVLDYNETRSSDVFVVNFGAHYHFPPGEDDDELFKADVAPILDAMAELGDKATVVWREISPTHFPAENGTYDAFVSNQDGNPIEVNTCCTGTPPKVLDRNLWVENYLRDNGLMDRVKLLRIYDMSRTRGSAHHTCHLAPPSTMDQRKAAKNRCRAVGMPDCVHWSETGVVEEWNRLLLNHICSSSEGGVAARGP